jgi:hypothetical protein
MNRPRKSEPALRLTHRGYLVFGILWGASFVGAMVTANIGLPGWGQ